MEVEEAEAWYEWYKNYIPPDQDSSEPVSDVYMPIFSTRTLQSVIVVDPATNEGGGVIRDETDSNITTSSSSYVDELGDEERYDAVGLLAATWYWRDVIKDLLPEGSTGFVVVFENPCNPSFTYQLDGPNTVYLGRGDLHQTKYDEFRFHSDLKDLRYFYVSESAARTHVPLNEEYCPFHITVYPSDEMRDTFVTKDPALYTGIAVSIFLFTACLFVMYDCTVRRRHMVVMDNAAASNAVVSSLFPEGVRERIKQDKVKEQRQRRKVAAKRHKMKRRSSREQLTALRQEMRSVRSDTSSLNSKDYRLPDNPIRPNDDIVKGLDGNPIAEVYPVTTVMMAGISGFSAWSSARGM